MGIRDCSTRQIRLHSSRRKVKITLVENKSIMVFVEPQRLREIADSLEKQQERHLRMKTGHLLDLDCQAESLDSLGCQLHNGNLNIWFRPPNS